MLTKIACVFLVLVVCFSVPAFAQMGGGAGVKGSAGMMFDAGGTAGPYLNLSTRLSTQETFDLTASVGAAFFSAEGISLSIFPAMINVESKATESQKSYFGAGAGLLFATASYAGESGSGSLFGYQVFAGHNFSPKMFGELKLIGVSGSGGVIYAVSVGSNF